MSVIFPRKHTEYEQGLLYKVAENSSNSFTHAHNKDSADTWQMRSRSKAFPRVFPNFPFLYSFATLFFILFGYVPRETKRKGPRVFFFHY